MSRHVDPPEPCMTCGWVVGELRRDMCHRCYDRTRRIERGLPVRPTEAERLARAFTSGWDHECWLWTSTIDADGYGKFSIKGAGKRAHRVVYERLIGPIPDGLVLDHLCRVRHCVNPNHLEPVTDAENTRRGMAPQIIAWRAGTCRRGHPMVDNNVYVRPDGTGRWCKVCDRMRQRRRRQREREAAES